MKKAALLLALFLSSLSFAQKMGVVDTDYILNRLPQYQQAKQRLDQQIKSWEDEVLSKQTKLEELRTAFENERVLLVGDQLKQRKKEIDDLDAEIKRMVSGRFGTNGEVTSMRSSLVQPFQDQIWNAIKTVAEKNNLGMVFDKSNNISVLYLEKRFDYTDRVLDILLKNDKRKNN